MSLRLLRAEIWARDDVKKLHRVTVRSLPDGRIEGPAVVVVSRLVITGGNHHRLHEEFTEAGRVPARCQFPAGGQGDGNSPLVEDSQPGALSSSTFDALRTRFREATEAILAAVESRSKDRLRFLRNKIDAQKVKGS